MVLCSATLYDNVMLFRSTQMDPALKDTVLEGVRWSKEEKPLHAVDVVLLGVGACQEEPLCWRDLIWSVHIHARGLSVQRLTNLHD